MEKQVTFHDLATHLRMLLESESYSQTTVKDMDFILNSFASYMDKNGLVVYSPEIGERLIQYCEVELKVCASRVTRARVIVRKLNRLNQGLDGREALWGDKTSPIVLPADFEKILSAYISYCRKKGNKQTTLHYKQWICGRFLKNLSSSGCEKAEDISGDMVQLAFLQLKFSRYWERIGPFLRFLFEKGYTKLNYSMLIQHRKRNSPYPTVYSVDEITTVESSIDGLHLPESETMRSSCFCPVTASDPAILLHYRLKMLTSPITGFVSFNRKRTILGKANCFLR